MQSSRFGGRVAMLVVLSMLLAGSSLTLPWYRFSDPWGEPGRAFEVHIGSVYLEPGGDRFTSLDSVQTLTDVVRDFVYIWLFVAFVFLGAVFINDKSLSLIAGIATVVAGFGSLAYFALGISGAIHKTSGWEDITWPHGFAGSAGEGVVTYTWGPLDGFLALLAAAVLQTSAVFVRTVVVISDM